MWVFCPMTQKIPGALKPGATVPEKVPMPPEVTLVWGGKKHTLKKGINEITPEVAQAFFLFALPDKLESDEDLYHSQIKIALQRWGVAMKCSPPDIEFLKPFDLAENLEGLQNILKEKQAEQKTSN